MISILQRTLGHFAEKHTASDGDDIDGIGSDSEPESGTGHIELQGEGKSDEPDSAPPPAAIMIGVSSRSNSGLNRDRLGSQRGVRLPPLAVRQQRHSIMTTPTPKLRNTNCWLFARSLPDADTVALRCLEVLYQVALVAAGDEGVGGGSGGRMSNASGQRSDKVYTPPAKIFQSLASPQVVSVVALVCTDAAFPCCCSHAWRFCICLFFQTLRAKHHAIVETALSLLETSLVWCRATSHSDIQLARTGLFELLLQVRDSAVPAAGCVSPVTHSSVCFVTA